MGRTTKSDHHHESATRAAKRDYTRPLVPGMGQVAASAPWLPWVAWPSSKLNAIRGPMQVARVTLALLVLIRLGFKLLLSFAIPAV
jgi:hypothetical protein